MSNTRKTLVIISPGFPADEADSTCIPPQQVFVKALKEVSPELHVIVLTLQYPFFSRTYDWHGVQVISFGTEKSSRPYRALVMLRVWRRLRQIRRKHKVAGLLSFWLDKSAFVAEIFAKRHGLQHYCWLLGQDAKAGNRFFHRIKPDGASLVAISDFVARNLHGNYGVLPQHVIPVGVNTALFDAAAVEKDIDILGAGSLIPLKQYHIFLELIKALRDSHPHLRTVICGDGPEMEHLRAKVKELGITDNVSLIGERPHADVLRLMQQAKIFLHPSNYEGFSTVCLEALCAGARVLSFIRPMEANIPNWSIATDQAHMQALLKDMLRQQPTAYPSFVPYRVQDTARAIIRLFDPGMLPHL
ncbi:glycosyltransferase [Chitinophaga agrisoli]|uniref:Glycosyltransferase n=1 Tax=Chitinophaga agrisoli TaxID=2607653 RepID=A0A5B2VK29_9BACT|nr:glycosyltransferase [Chitinophaga agrisoli]KAA2239028.1 glycosyltransferase [Chitinophaga agrisoli]